MAASSSRIAIRTLGDSSSRLSLFGATTKHVNPSFLTRQLGTVSRPYPSAYLPRKPIHQPLNIRSLHSSLPRRARYERFDSSNYTPPPSGSGGGGGRPRVDFMGYLRRRLGGDRAVLVYGLAVGGGVVYYVFHLEKVPETGRWRFIDVSTAQERELGYQTQLSTLSEYSRQLLPASSSTSKRVRNVATRIIEASGLGRVKSGTELGAIEGEVPKWGGGGEVGGLDVGEVLFGGSEGNQVREGKDTEWEVYVINDAKTKNAFVLPGGKIFVFTGILPVSANDDGLATVLGHEIAHQVARHPAERMSSMKVLFALNFLLESLGLDVGFSRILLTFLLQLPNSRKSESEADYIGLRLMSKACYDPREAPKMWERMSQSEGGKGSNMDFLSTHPANAKRIKQLEAWMPEALQIRAASCAGGGSSGGGYNDFGGFLGSLNPASFYGK